MNVLADVTVLDLGTFITGPHTAMLLADLGADVIKVERPGLGDPFRGMRAGAYSPEFQAHNRNKRSLTLDYALDDGRELLLELVRTADVVISNARPGVMERYGLAFADLRRYNARLIYCSITGFGAAGPYANRPAFDTIGQSLSGWLTLFHDGADPRIPGPAVTDTVTGMFACYGILGALHERTRTGTGRHVEVNMVEATLAFAAQPVTSYFASNELPGPYTRSAISQAFAFTCSDGRRLGIHLSSPEKFWQQLLVALERPDLAADPRFAAREGRVTNYAVLGEELQHVFAGNTRAHWTVRLEAADVPFAPILAFDELRDDPQLQALDALVDVVHPQYGTTTAVRRPVRYDGDRALAERPAPALGEHNAEILAPLGIDAARIAELRRRGVI